ncbi:MAG: TonB-dependent receptor [Candidatus Omnitrophota bacterium]|jgi:iron complex outermembrane receptor protein
MKKIFLCGIVTVIFASSFVYAGTDENDSIELGKIVVTPSRYPSEISDAANSITILDQGYIENSNGNNVVDVLRPQAGVVVRDWYGTGAKASVDIRGFGETAGMNTLVLIDGRRINETDLSGVDWTQIPLDQIERVEIVRGSGSVLYGDNAMGGVINIITKTGKGKPVIELSAKAGSYGMNSEKLNINGSSGNIYYAINAGRDSTNGYRENSYYDAQDFGGRFIYDIKPDLSINISAGYHDAKYGFPGALSEVHLQTRSRKDTRFPDDDANESDYYFKIGAKKDFEETSYIDTDLSFRRRLVDSYFLSSSAGFNPVFNNKIDTVGFTPRYVFSKDIFNKTNKLIIGTDLYSSDYSSDNYTEAGALSNFTDINKTSIAGYFHDELSIFDNLIFNGGYRYERAKYEFDYHDNTGFNSDVNSNLAPEKKAFDSGIVFKSGDSQVFFNMGKSFRFPATDEYFSVFATPPVNINLKPQSGRNYEAGIRHKFKNDGSADLSFFRMDINDELFLNPLTFANENYDKTRHQGVETSFNYRPVKYMNLFGNYTYSNSMFRGGIYDEKFIPMVPKHKGCAGISVMFPQDIKLDLRGNYTGKRYFISDQGNSLPRMEDYFTVDTRVSHEFKNGSCFFGINNIFDKDYSEYGVKSGSLRFYYPSPKRNFEVGAVYKW